MLSIVGKDNKAGEKPTYPATKHMVLTSYTDTHHFYSIAWILCIAFIAHTRAGR